MARKQYFIGIDVETSITDKVLDFGAVVIDRKGTIIKQCAVLVSGVFGTDSPFYDKNSSGIWAGSNVQARVTKYQEMLDSGSRMMASVNAINRWLEKVSGQYNPELFAYNLGFDVSRCANTNIDLSIFPNRFCLWNAAASMICGTKQYRQFVVENHLFNTPTKAGNMTFKTDAETVMGFLRGNMESEPHTAIEDMLQYEVPIFQHIVKKKNWRGKITPYNWNDFQVKNHFKAN